MSPLFTLGGWTKGWDGAGLRRALRAQGDRCRTQQYFPDGDLNLRSKQRKGKFPVHMLVPATARPGLTGIVLEYLCIRGGPARRPAPSDGVPCPSLPGHARARPLRRLAGLQTYRIYLLATPSPPGRGSPPTTPPSAPLPLPYLIVKD